MTLTALPTIDETWRDLAKKSDSNDLTIRSADAVSDIIVKLIETRVKKQLTQKQVAEKAGLKQSAVARLESLTTFPRIDTIIKVALVLGLQIEANDDISEKLSSNKVIYVYNANDMYSKSNSGYYNSVQLGGLYG